MRDGDRRRLRSPNDSLPRLRLGLGIRVIGGSLRGRRLATPRDAAVRPTSARVREAVFDILQGSVDGARVLDLFAGSGAMGIEAISRGAMHATFVEQAKETAVVLARNVAELDLESRSRLLRSRAAEALGRLGEERERFDLVFLDPPYADDPTGLLLRIAEIGIAPGTIVLEVARRRRLDAPAGWACDRRRYGDTELLVLRAG